MEKKKTLHLLSESKTGVGWIEDTPLSLKAPAEETALNHVTRRTYVGAGPLPDLICINQS